MTQGEFNNKYIDYLDDGHYGMDLGRDADPDMIKFLDEVFENILVHVPGFKFQQIKTKFGYARFYTNLRPIEFGIAIENRMNYFLNKDK